MINDPVDDAFIEIYNAIVADYTREQSLGLTDFLNILTEYGLMIVPIEDPLGFRE